MVAILVIRFRLKHILILTAIIAVAMGFWRQLCLVEVVVVSKGTFGFQGEIIINQLRTTCQQVRLPHLATNETHTFVFLSKSPYLELFLTNDKGVRTAIRRQIGSYLFGRKLLLEIYDSDFPEQNIYGQTNPLDLSGKDKPG